MTQTQSYYILARFDRQANAWGFEMGNADWQATEAARNDMAQCYDKKDLEVMKCDGSRESVAMAIKTLNDSR